MDLTAYQEKYSDIITGIQPWQSPDGQPDPSRQSVLTNGMGRLIKVDNQMCATTVAKDGQTGLDPDFKMEDRLMNGRLSVKPKSDKHLSKTTIEFYEVKDIRVDEIIVSKIFQMRVAGVKQDVVVRYANIMKDNDPDGWTAFPEILIMKDTGSLKYYVIGGFHRLAAIKENGYETINAICFDGDRQLGIIKAANENSDRSQRRNHEDIKHVCRTLIELFPDWTFGQLAKWGGVDRNTIERHYKEMEAEGIAPDRPDQLRYITRHGTEATRKATRDTKPRDEYADISTGDLVDRWSDLSDKTHKFAIEKNGLPPGNFLIDEGTLRSHAGTHYPNITHDMADLMDEDSIFIRGKVVDQVKIWSDFVQQAEGASDIFVAMFANFDYELEKRGGERFPDIEECNWIVDLGLPNALNETINRTKNRYSNLSASLGLEAMPFDEFFRYAEKQYPQQLVVTAEGRESNLNAIQNWYVLGQDITNRADWIEEIEKRVMMDRYDNLTSEVWSLWDKHFKKKFTWQAIKENARQKWPAIVDEYEFSPADKPIEALHVQINIWTELKAELETTIDKETTTEDDDMDRTEDFGGFSEIVKTNKQDPDYIKVYEEAVAAMQAAKDTYNAVKKELGFTGLPWQRPNQPTHEKKCFRAYAIIEGQMLTLVDPAFDTSIDFQERLVTVWQTLKQDLETPAEWVKTAAWQYKASLLEDEAEVDDAELESEAEDYEHKSTYDFVVAKCDEAIRTYEENQESLGLSALNWYGAEGFFYYAQAELERQGKKLGYANHMDTITRLSEKAKLWESVTNAIKHKANWVKAVVGEEERKTEREKQDAIKECRKLVKEAKRRFHKVREPLGFPDLEWEHFISTYAQKQFEAPLVPHVLENAPLDKLKDRCGVWVAIKSVLSAARPLAWVADIAQQHKRQKFNQTL